ncbi:MAG: MEDS domain-containing protein [Candidatus Bathyarchaeia archaeon]
MKNQEIADFVRELKPTDHVIMFYSKPEDKHEVLFSYLKAGLDQGEAAAYVAAQESPDEIIDSMRRFGVEVDRLEKSGALRVLSYKDWYFKEGRFSIENTMKLWKALLDEAKARGFKSLRVTGEMAFFFEKKMVKELLEYENALHRTLELPLTAICAYDAEAVAKEGRGRLYLDLIKAHRSVIITGPAGGVVSSY